MYVAHGNLLHGEDKIKCMTALVRGLSDVLNEAVALCQLRQLYSVCVIVYVDVYNSNVVGAASRFLFCSLTDCR